jgi:hypothetical protein
LNFALDFDPKHGIEIGLSTEKVRN